jgi:predicted ATPase
MEETDKPLVETVKAHLADKDLLIVLDNFEQVTEASEVVGQLLAAAPRLKVIVTSRVNLSLYGEQEVPISPLPLPDPAHLPEDLARLSRYDSVTLFIERARAARPGFEVTDDNAPAVAEITARLDGLPLAIELAASRAKLLPPQQILARLDQALPLLVGGPRDLPERQRTLRGAIAWSYDLLGPPKRHLFARLSVFRGGCSLEGAGEVGNPRGDLGINILEGVGSLVDSSLLRPAEADGEARFRMLDTIREFAGERLLEDFDAEDTARRHAEHLVRLAEAAEPQLEGDESVRWLAALDRELDNIRAALDWSEDRDHGELAMRVAAPIWRFVHQRAHFSEGRGWLERALALPSAQEITPLRGKTLLAAGSVAYWQGDYEATTRYYEQAVAAYQRTDDRAGLALALHYSSTTKVLAGDIPGAIRLDEEALPIFRELGDEKRVAEVLGHIGYFRSLMGDHAGALETLSESIAIYRRTGASGFLLADGLAGLGQAHRFMGRFEEARTPYREALTRFREAGNESGVAMVLDMFGTLASAEGKHDRAVRLAGAADSIKERIGGGAPEEVIRVGNVREPATEALGEDAVARLWEEGRSMGKDAAVAEAMEGSPE